MNSPRARAEQTGLIVPVDLLALCVGEVDATEVTNHFAGPTAVYREQVRSGAEAFLGTNVTRSFSESPAQRLKTGIHLHWALPDGLTRAVASRGRLQFPATPNRWLVCRYLLNGADPPAIRCWLVESDAVQKEASPGQVAVTLPVRPTSVLPQNFGYLGRYHELDENWTPQAVSAAPLLRDVAQTELTAVSNGEIGFAAYYPGCSSVFGFWDQLTDIRVPANEPASLSYVLIGWFDLQSNDPVSEGSTAQSLARAYGWTYSGEASPSFSLFSGQVQGLQWSSKIEYLKGSGIREPISAKAAAIGNNPAQALSAYFASNEQPTTPLFEKLLDAFQLGLLTDFKQPKPDQLTQLDEDLHDSGFAKSAGGELYAVVSREDAGREDASLIELPPALAEDLNLLNELVQQLDSCTAHLDWLRWQLFANWYRIFESDTEEDQQAAFMAAYHRLQTFQQTSPEQQQIEGELRRQISVVQNQLGRELVLERVPAEPFQQPAEPAVLLVGDGIRFPERHGGDGRYDPNGLLVCRTSDQLLSTITVNGQSVQAQRFASVTAPQALSHSELCTALLREGCLLDTQLMAAIVGTQSQSLQQALRRALRDEEQTVYSFTGRAPSPVSVNWWEREVWLPLFASWTVSWLPIQPTVQQGKPLSYTPDFFNANFKLDQDAGGRISYQPGDAPHAIHVDPATARFAQTYSAESTLTPSSAETLERLLGEYLPDHPDESLQRVLEDLRSSDFVTASLSGFTNLLLMRRQGLQLNVEVPERTTYYEFTQEISPVIGHANTVGPEFQGYFNPIRAGFLKLELQLVDAYGQKRDVRLPPLICADSMRTVVEGRALPAVTYLPPRVAQPCRLLARWISADSPVQEMNSDPASSPVCGWLLPNHLDNSIALYNRQGHALGSLFLQGAEGAQTIGWQSAPGDDRTIAQTLEEVMDHENAQLRALAIKLRDRGAAFFTAFWKVIDTVGASVSPAPVASDASMATLGGRPVALAQALLRLEGQGRPALDLGWDVPAETDSDAGLAEVQMPVVLGNLSKLSDGLVGYFKSAERGYELSTFYSQGAEESAQSGVVRPTQETLTLTLSPKLSTSDSEETTQGGERVLMLLDPRGRVHATSGILPTATLELPSDQINAALSALDITFFTAPVLRSQGALVLPTPQQNGFQLSWIEQHHSEEGRRRTWTVTPQIESPAGRAVWPYTPQQISEGWLRLNPVLLRFELLDAAGKPVVREGQANTMTLNITNNGERDITFLPGSPVPEGTAPNGSIFYIHFGGLLAEEDIQKVDLSATGWTFTFFRSTQYGAYWAASASRAISLAQRASLTVAVSELRVATHANEGLVYFDYYDIDGLDDGVYADALTVQSGAAA